MKKNKDSICCGSICRCAGCGQRCTLKMLLNSCGKKFRDIIKTVSLVLFYYVFSIGLTFYNRWMFKDFHFPLMTTCIHFLTVFVISALVRLICSPCRQEVTTLEWGVYLKKVFLTGIASALDIGLSNWSFVFITISLYTMVKSSCVIFILGFALALKLEKPRCSLVAVVCLIAGGLFIFVYESSQFNLEGFLLVLTASFIGGIRWTFSQIIAQKKELGLGNPIDLLYHLQPIMFIGLFPLAMAHEGLHFFTAKNIFYWDVAGTEALTIIKILIGGMVAFMLSYSEYLLLTNTSSLTLSISGIFKEILTLAIATVFNNNHLSPLNWVGFLVCISGISLHVALKVTDNSKDDVSKDDEQIHLQLLNHNDDSCSDSETELFNINKR